jgi:hypothetical protein
MTGGYVTRDNGQSWRMFNLRGGINGLSPSILQTLRTIYAGNAGLWRSSDSGRTWKMLFPSPARNTVEHQSATTPTMPYLQRSRLSRRRYLRHCHRSPKREEWQGSSEHLYLSFEQRGQPAVIVSSLDGGASWSRLATCYPNTFCSSLRTTPA